MEKDHEKKLIVILVTTAIGAASSGALAVDYGKDKHSLARAEACMMVGMNQLITAHDNAYSAGQIAPVFTIPTCNSKATQYLVNGTTIDGANVITITGSEIFGTVRAVFGPNTGVLSQGATCLLKITQDGTTWQDLSNVPGGGDPVVVRTVASSYDYIIACTAVGLPFGSNAIMQLKSLLPNSAFWSTSSSAN